MVALVWSAAGPGPGLGGPAGWGAGPGAGQVGCGAGPGGAPAGGGVGPVGWATEPAGLGGWAGGVVPGAGAGAGAGGWAIRVQRSSRLRSLSLSTSPARGSVEGPPEAPAPRSLRSRSCRRFSRSFARSCRRRRFSSRSRWRSCAVTGFRGSGASGGALGPSAGKSDRGEVRACGPVQAQRPSPAAPSPRQRRRLLEGTSEPAPQGLEQGSFEGGFGVV